MYTDMRVLTQEVLFKVSGYSKEQQSRDGKLLAMVKTRFQHVSSRDRVESTPAKTVRLFAGTSRILSNRSPCPCCLLLLFAANDMLSSGFFSVFQTCTLIFGVAESI